MLIYLILLIFSIVTLAASISLINYHRRLDKSMGDYTKPINVEFSDYLLSGALGYLGLSASIIGICVCLYLIFITNT